jgi:hypothetical protein
MVEESDHDRSGKRAERPAAVPPSSYLLVVLGAVSYLLLMANWFALAAFLDPIADGLGLSDT